MGRGNGRFDKLGIGFAAGLIIPVLIFFVIFFMENHEVTLPEYLKGLWQLRALIKLISLCVFGNLLLFWYFLRIKFELAARGVLGATFIYAFLVLLSRIF